MLLKILYCKYLPQISPLTWHGQTPVTHLDTVGAAIEETDAPDGVQNRVGRIIQHVVSTDWGERMALIEEGKKNPD